MSAKSDVEADRQRLKWAAEGLALAVQRFRAWDCEDPAAKEVEFGPGLKVVLAGGPEPKIIIHLPGSAD